MVPQFIVEVARIEAEKSYMKYKLGAVVFDKKFNILGVGHNRWFRQSEKMCGLKIEGNVPRLSIHAEIDAINHVRRDKRYLMFGIYVYRKNNRLAMPCKKCQKWIQKNGINNIEWSE